MERLVAVELTVEEGDTSIKVGEKYTYYKDPETGKFYRPAPGDEITGDDLEKRFVEVPTA